MSGVPDKQHVWWVIGADGLHMEMSPSCIRSWWNDNLLSVLRENLDAYKSKGIVLHAVVYGVPPPLPWKKLKYAGKTNAENQSEEAVHKYNQEMKAWIDANVRSLNIFYDVVFIDPAKAVQQANEIGETKGSAAEHFRNNDGTHPGHMANTANAQIFFNAMYQSMLRSTGGAAR